MDASMFQIRVPRATEWMPSVAAACMKSLTTLVDKDIYFSLYVTGTSEGVVFRVTIDTHPSITLRSLGDLFAAYYPGAEVLPYIPQIPPYPFHRRIVLLYRLGEIWFETLPPPLNYQRFDPIAVLTQTMAGLRVNESVTYKITSKMWHFTQQDIDDFLTISAHDAGWRTSGRIPVLNPAMAAGAIIGKIISDWQLKSKRVLRFSEADTERYLSKFIQGHTVTSISVIMDSPYKERLNLVSSVVGAVVNLTGAGALRIGNGMDDEKRITTVAEADAFTTTSLVNKVQYPQGYSPVTFYPSPEELALLWHLPHVEFGDQPIIWTSGLPVQVTTHKGKDTIQIGTVRREETPVYLSREDRQHHTYITGKTGMGKSTLLENLIKQDIEAGEGVAVIDPPGSLIASLLSRCIPESRLNDVVLLSCANETYPVPINPFHISPNVTSDEQLQAVLWLMKTLYREHWSSTRMETTMRNVLQLVLADPDATPLDMQEIIENPKWRTRLFSRLKKANKLSTSTERFWERFDTLSPSEQSDYASPILNRLGFLGSAHLEMITCHPQTVDFRQLIRDKKIILIDLSGNVIASEVGMLGSIFLFNLFFASQSLFFSSNHGSHPFYLYADEVQEFVSSDLAKMLSEARKYGLSLTLASQYIGQLNDETQEAIKNNVGTKISFECGDDEARETARLYEPQITAKDMIGLGRGNAAIRTRFSGETLKPFIIRTLAPPTPTAQQVNSRLVVERSRENLHLIPSSDVREWIKQRYSDDEPVQPTGLKDFE